MNVHEVRKKDNKILLYIKSNNARENLLFAFSILEVFRLVLFVSFGWIAITKEDEVLFSAILVVIISLLVIWRLNQTIRPLINVSISNHGKRDVTKELKNSAALLGRALAKELAVEYFWENKIIDLSQKQTKR